MDIQQIKRAQRVLRATAGYKGAIDGDPGPGSLAAAWRLQGPGPSGWPPARLVVRAAQVALAAAGLGPGVLDGFWGTQTDGAYIEWRARGLGTGMPDRDGGLPFGGQSGMQTRFGAPGGAMCTAGQIVPPWPMVLAWDQRHRLGAIRCHQDVAASGQRAFDRIAATYDQVSIRALGLHLFGGCFNNRPVRGGTRKSTHAWGVAIDFDPMRNRLNWNAGQARLAQPDAVPFWEAWEAEGWTSLGRARDFDWMHVQAPGLR